MFSRIENNYKNRKNRNYVFIFSLLLTSIVVFIGIFLPQKFDYISTKLFNVLIAGAGSECASMSMKGGEVPNQTAQKVP